MKNNSRLLPFLPEFQKFITSSSTGRRIMPSGKKLRKGTIVQYNCVYSLLKEFECTLEQPLRIVLLSRISLRTSQKEKNYWSRFFKKFSSFLYKDKNFYDQYVGSIFKVIKTFFHYLKVEKAYPVGEFHKNFRVPGSHFTPAIISPSQLKFLITDLDFEGTLNRWLLRAKDIFVFGCTVGLRFRDLMNLKKANIQYSPDGVFVLLHTQKTGTEVKIPLPDYAESIIHKYRRKAGRYVLPRLSGTNLNIQLKNLAKKAGWDYSLPKVRQRQGESVEILRKDGQGFRFYDHITIHTMRRTAITTLLLMGVDENSVRRISGHAPGSKEFYRYVVIVQDYLNTKVKQAHFNLLNGPEKLTYTAA